MLGDFYGIRDLWQLGRMNKELMEKWSNVFVFGGDCNGKMVEGFNVFVISLLYQKMWKVI